jgi:hypothetical protein
MNAPREPARPGAPRAVSTGLDGNAAAGVLAAAFGADMTTARGVCATCGSGFVLAEVAVYIGAATVLRCRACGAVLTVLLERRGLVCADLQGLELLDVPG